MIPAVQLLPGHIIVQRIGPGVNARKELREVRDVELTSINRVDWVHARVTENRIHLFSLFYPPAWPVEILNPRGGRR